MVYCASFYKKSPITAGQTPPRFVTSLYDNQAREGFGSPLDDFNPLVIATSVHHFHHSHHDHHCAQAKQSQNAIS
jgi:hypothetical protein